MKKKKTCVRVDQERTMKIAAGVERMTKKKEPKKAKEGAYTTYSKEILTSAVLTGDIKAMCTELIGLGDRARFAWQRDSIEYAWKEQYKKHPELLLNMFLSRYGKVLRPQVKAEIVSRVKAFEMAEAL